MLDTDYLIELLNNVKFATTEQWLCEIRIAAISLLWNTLKYMKKQNLNCFQ